MLKTSVLRDEPLTESKLAPAGTLGGLSALIAEGKRGDAVEYFLTVAIGLPKEMVAGMRQMPMWPGLA